VDLVSKLLKPQFGSDPRIQNFKPKNLYLLIQILSGEY